MLQQPHLFYSFIESGRSLSTFLKTKPTVALNTGRSLWGLFPLKSLLITLQSMWVILQGTLLTWFATIMKQQLQKQQEPFSCLSAGLQPLPSTSVTPVFHVNSFSWVKNGFRLFFINAGSEMALTPEKHHAVSELHQDQTAAPLLCWTCSWCLLSLYLSIRDEE